MASPIMISYLLILILVLTAIVPILLEVRQNRFDFFNLKNPFIAYYLLQLAVSGLVTLSTGIPSEIGLDPLSNATAYEAAFGTAALGMLCFQVGYYWRVLRIPRVPGMMMWAWIPARGRMVAIAYLLLGFLAFHLLMALNGGIAQFLGNREAFRSSGLIGQGILIFPATALMSVSALIYVLLSEKRSVGTTTKALSILALALVPAYFLGFRSALALAIVPFLVAWNYGRRQIPALRVFLMTGLLIAGFSVYGLARELPEGVSLDPGSAAELIMERPELAYAVVSRSKGAEVVAAVIAKLDREGGYQFGWPAAVELATIAIPKVVWPDKPDPISQKFANYFFSDDLRFARGYDQNSWGGISPTVIGEMYWHFGIIGVIVGMLMLGRVARLIYCALRANVTHKGVVICYSVFYTLFAMSAETLQGYANGFVHYSVALAATLVLLGRRSRTEQGCGSGVGKFA